MCTGANAINGAQGAAHPSDLVTARCDSQDGSRLEIIKPADVQHALTLLGQSSPVVEKAGHMLEKLFPTKAPTYREFASFLRFGKVACEHFGLRKLS